MEWKLLTTFSICKLIYVLFIYFEYVNWQKVFAFPRNTKTFVRATYIFYIQFIREKYRFVHIFTSFYLGFT